MSGSEENFRANLYERTVFRAVAAGRIVRINGSPVWLADHCDYPAEEVVSGLSRTALDSLIAVGLVDPPSTGSVFYTLSDNRKTLCLYCDKIQEVGSNAAGRPRIVHHLSKGVDICKGSLRRPGVVGRS